MGHLRRQLKKLRDEKIDDVGNSDIRVSQLEKDTEEDGAALFNSLPIPIITTIFGHLPMKDAIQMCSSSKQLGHLLMHIPNIEFYESVDLSLQLSTGKKRREFIEMIDRFLGHHEGPIRSFRLFFDPIQVGSVIDRWISLLVKNDIQEIDLRFANWYECYQLPSCLCSSKTVSVLKLESCIFQLPSTFDGFKNLQTLALVNMPLSDNLIHSLLSKCGLLSSFTLKNCNGFQEINASNLSTQLKCLTLEQCTPVEISAPNLQALYLRGLINFPLKEHSRVLKVVIFRDMNSWDDLIGEAYILKDRVLGNLVEMHSLSLIGQSVTCFGADFVPDGMACTYCLRTLELEVCLFNEQDIRVITCFLRSSPNLEEFIIRVRKAARFIDKWSKLRAMGYFELLNKDHPAFCCLNDHLQQIKLINFGGTKPELELIEFFLKNTLRLKTMTINPVKEMEPGEQFRIFQRLSLLPKASIDAELAFDKVET